MASSATTSNGSNGTTTTTASSAGGAGGGAGVTSRPTKRQRTWHIPASDTARLSINPIRNIVDSIVMPKRDDIIRLSLGDPTVFGNLKSPKLLMDKIKATIDGGKNNGYVHAAGTPQARAAIARRYSCAAAPLTADDVVISCGGSGALEMAISVLCNAGQNILLPKPLFPLYETLASSKKVESRFYSLLPDHDWEADLKEMESLIDDKTAAILVNNPSNPCGSVYSKAHLEAILAIADRHKVPVISDEIYRNMVFSGNTFYAMGELSSTVPVLSVGGLAKEFLVPGWRVGWVMVHDKNGVFEEVRKGLFKLATLILGASTIIQACIPTILARPDDTTADAVALKEALADTMAVVEANARFCEKELRKIKGLRTIVPRGALYTMVGIDPASFKDIANDFDFCQKLLSEEGVFVLPGQCFKMDNFFRVVYCAPQEVLADAFKRLNSFCDRHRK